MGASKKILDFFSTANVTSLIGRETNLSVDFDPQINKDDGFKFKNKEVDSLMVETIGQCKYTDFVLALTQEEE